MFLDNKWLYSRVTHGSQAGRRIGFPTINLNPKLLSPTTKLGVYACKVRILNDDSTYDGALYFGPRLIFGENNLVLEVHIINFEKDLYEQEISFSINQFIRPPLKFQSLDDLKKQLKLDIDTIKNTPLAND